MWQGKTIFKTSYIMVRLMVWYVIVTDSISSVNSDRVASDIIAMSGNTSLRTSSHAVR